MKKRLIPLKIARWMNKNDHLTLDEIKQKTKIPLLVLLAAIESGELKDGNPGKVSR